MNLRVNEKRQGSNPMGSISLKGGTKFGFFEDRFCFKLKIVMTNFPEKFPVHSVISSITQKKLFSDGHYVSNLTLVSAVES